MPGPQRRPSTPDTLYLGRVEKVTGATATVIVPELGGPGYAYGPARYPDHLKPGALTGAGEPGPEQHTHPAAGLALAAGDPVLVGVLAGSGTRDSIVILARLA